MISLSPARMRATVRPLVLATCLALLAVGLVPALGEVGAADEGPPTAQVVAEAIADAPRLSFSDDGFPVIAYRDLDPFEELVDEDGERIPDSVGSRTSVVVCSDALCAEPPVAHTRLPVESGEALAVVVGRDVIFARDEAPPSFSICDVATCLGGLVLSNLAPLTSQTGAVRDLVRGADGTHHVLVSDTTSDVGSTSWIVRCRLAACAPEDVIAIDGEIRALSIQPDGSPVAAVVESDGSVGAVNCTTPTCAENDVASGLLPGVDALAVDGDGGPIVAALQASGSIQLAHCSSPTCPLPDPPLVASVDPAPGAAITELVAMTRLPAGTPVLSYIETAADGSIRGRVVAIPACATPGCDTDAELSAILPGDAAIDIDIAVSPAGDLHAAADRAAATRPDGRPAYAEMSIDHQGCDIVCQCKISTCLPRSVAEVCLSDGSAVGGVPGPDPGQGQVAPAIVDLGIGGVAPLSGPSLYLGTDADEMITVRAGDVVCASGGDDTVVVVAGDPAVPEPDGVAVWILGGEGNDTIDVSAAPLAQVWGGGGHDVIIGSPGDDALDGGSGDDLIAGIDGDDTIHGGTGNDAAWGGPGQDVMAGGTGADRLRGGPGDDTIHGDNPDDSTPSDAAADGADDIGGGSGDDSLFGQGGADTIRGGTGDDMIDAGEGDDVLANGNGGSDVVIGGPGDDQLVAGGPRPDRVEGSAGNDIVKGNGGADTLDGGPGNDQLRGGPQPDTLVGGTGVDSCIGGTEPDMFDQCEFVTE